MDHDRVKIVLSGRHGSLVIEMPEVAEHSGVVGDTIVVRVNIQLH
jgi:hypothetical protein